MDAAGHDAKPRKLHQSRTTVDLRGIAGLFWPLGEKFSRFRFHRMLGLCYLVAWAASLWMVCTDVDAFLSAPLPWLLPALGVGQAGLAVYYFRFLPKRQADPGYYSDNSALSFAFVKENVFFALLLLFQAAYYSDRWYAALAGVASGVTGPLAGDASLGPAAVAGSSTAPLASKSARMTGAGGVDANATSWLWSPGEGASAEAAAAAAWLKTAHSGWSAYVAESGGSTIEAAARLVLGRRGVAWSARLVVGRILEAAFVFLPYVTWRRCFPQTRFRDSLYAPKNKSEANAKFFYVGTWLTKAFFVWAKHYIGFCLNYVRFADRASRAHQEHMALLHVWAGCATTISMFLHTLKFKRLLGPKTAFSAYVVSYMATFWSYVQIADIFVASADLCLLALVGVVVNLTCRRRGQAVWQACVLLLLNAAREGILTWPGSGGLGISAAGIGRAAMFHAASAAPATALLPAATAPASGMAQLTHGMAATVGEAGEL